jgi:hypothetical protein
MILPYAKLPESILPTNILVRLDRCSSALRHFVRWGFVFLIIGFVLSLLVANLVVSLPAGHWSWPFFVWIIPPILCLAALGLLLSYSLASFVAAESQYFRLADISEEEWINHCVALEEREIWLDLTEPSVLIYYQKHFSREEYKGAMKAAADRKLAHFRRSIVAKMNRKGRWMANYLGAPEWFY